MRSPEADWQGWVRKAENDALAVQSILAGEEVPWDVVCFHAQQVAEKLMKALLVLDGVQPARTHDLVALLSECATHRPELESLVEDCRLLTVFAVQARYPDDLAEPVEEDGRAALDAMERVREALREHLPGRGRPDG
jgi:HEPN domain-containing protein